MQLLLATLLLLYSLLLPSAALLVSLLVTYGIVLFVIIAINYSDRWVQNLLDVCFALYGTEIASSLLLLLSLSFPSYTNFQVGEDDIDIKCAISYRAAEVDLLTLARVEIFSRQFRVHSVRKDFAELRYEEQRRTSNICT